ncbi:YigZ family protein, partial [uncultured Desulfovibrio sp.]|uniref:YigZ family protein n=1 Tax=uncultured Desulfovibrio sp. TaxID=167968 RepID=UPI00262EBB4B
PHCTELVIRRSRFLAQCAHTPGPQAARAFVEQIRRHHADATHNCWAYAAGAPGDTAQIGSSDDGEPHGTAGRPMLQIVLHSDVGEICVVVSRWFGGVKLGTGGLVRAYQDSVRENLVTLPLRRRVQETRLRLVLAYAHLDGLRRLLPAYEARIDTEDYQAEAHLLLRLPEEHAAAFTAALAGLSNGAALCESAPEDG